MKYIERYIKTLSTTVKVAESHTTDSVYYQIGDFKIRCSDHVSPKNCADLQIIKCYGTDMFIVIYGKTRVPIPKTRKEVKDFIKCCFDIHNVNAMYEKCASGNSIKPSIAQVDAINWKDHTAEAVNIMTKRDIKDTDTWARYGTVLNVFNFKLSKPCKRQLEKYYNTTSLKHVNMTNVLYNLNDLGRKNVTVKEVVTYCEKGLEIIINGKDDNDGDSE